MKTPIHLIAIVAKYHGATDTLGTRVSLLAPHWEECRSLFSPWDCSFGSLDEQGRAILHAAGIEIKSFSNLGKNVSFQVSFNEVDKVKKMFKLR